MSKLKNELTVVPSSVAEFDPANGIIPFPNNLLFAETGLLNIPAGCNETETAALLRTVLLNGIDLRHDERANLRNVQ